MQTKTTTLKFWFSLVRMSVIKNKKGTDADMDWTKGYILLEM